MTPGSRENVGGLLERSVGWQGTEPVRLKTIWGTSIRLMGNPRAGSLFLWCVQSHSAVPSSV